jgi:hypothetical protein
MSSYLPVIGEKKIRANGVPGSPAGFWGGVQPAGYTLRVFLVNTSFKGGKMNGKGFSSAWYCSGCNWDIWEEWRKQAQSDPNFTGGCPIYTLSLKKRKTQSDTSVNFDSSSKN